MKKFAFLIPLLSFIVLSLSGCTNQPQNNTPPAQEIKKQSESKVKSNKKEKSAQEKNAECVKYNDGLRSGSCTKDAPSYCQTVYYPPSCEGCQDGQGCGFEE